MTYHASIFIKPDEAELIRHYIDDEPKCEEEAFIDGAITYDATFFNGYEMQVGCFGVGYYDADETNTAWTQAVLFDEFGNEVGNEMAEWSSEFFSDWTLTGSDGNDYVVHIIMNKED